MSGLISRQSALDALDGVITVTGRTNAEAVREYANLVCDRIKRLPSAEPKNGRWVERAVYSDNKNQWQSARCSACNKYHTTPYLYYFDDWNYCPNCGAKMEKEVE